MLKAIFFDLDGTLLPLNEQNFVNTYFGMLCEKLKPYGYDSEKLIGAIWQGTKAMYKNDGSKTNEQAFWDCFKSIYGEEKLKDKWIFEEFYNKDFVKVKICCEENSLAKKIVEYAKNKTGKVVLSTNPIFPKLATQLRMSFIGLKETNFDCVTYYETENYAKPNPKYFISLLDRLNLKADEVIVFGNNDKEDYECAKSAGIKCYLVGDYIIYHDGVKVETPILKMEDIINIIDLEYENRK